MVKVLMVLGSCLLMSCLMGTMSNAEAGGSGTAGGGSAGGVAQGGGSGSAGGTSAAPDWVSGTRIRARVQTTPDGAKAFLGWYDSQVQINCGFQRAADDMDRCLPTEVASIIGAYWGDAGCTVPLAIVGAGSCQLAYASKSETTTTCLGVAGNRTAARVHIYGGAAAYSGINYWVGSPGSCTMESTAATPNLFFTYGAEVPASTFATGSVITE